MLRRFWLGCILGLWLLLRAAPCKAEPVRDIGFDLRRDLALAGSLLGLNLIAALAWPAPDEPRWTRVSSFDLRVSEALGADQPARAARGSDALSLGAGVLRIASGWHWATDVVAGWAIGSAFGAGVPLLHELVSKRRTARRGKRASLRVGRGPAVQLSLVL